MQFLVGYDGSDISKGTLALARTHAIVFDAKVFVVFSMGGGSKETPAIVFEAEKELESVKAFLRERGVECEIYQLATGLSPGEDIVRFAEENKCDQIFVGLRKRSKTQKLILGSTAQYIILNAPCPVLTINRSFIG
jgi:nucleotide-binding universal stress UspA family protein